LVASARLSAWPPPMTRALRHSRAAAEAVMSSPPLMLVLGRELVHVQAAWPRLRAWASPPARPWAHRRALGALQGGCLAWPRLLAWLLAQVKACRPPLVRAGCYQLALEASKRWLRAWASRLARVWGRWPLPSEVLLVPSLLLGLLLGRGLVHVLVA